jgi:(p)ppGpp synthase/HD superfamily hydrolase
MNHEQLYKAIQFASKAHEGQKRKGKNPAPYISHPVFVGMELLRLGYNEEIVVAGVLHDTLEDGFPDLGRNEVKELILKEFGNKVLGLIEAVTEFKDPSMTKEEKMKTWVSRKKAYLKQLKSASIEARAIACADMYANMLEFKQTLREEGADIIKLFNVDMEKKLKHWEDEIQLFASDMNSLYSNLIPEMRNILIEIQKILREYYEKSN